MSHVSMRMLAKTTITTLSKALGESAAMNPNLIQRPAPRAGPSPALDLLSKSSAGVAASTEIGTHTVGRPIKPEHEVIQKLQGALFTPGGPASTLGTPSSSWILPSNVRVLTLSSATSG